MKACRSPPLLVAHSLACLLVAHWAHRSALVPKGAFLVAVPDPQSASFPSTARGFVPVPMVSFAFRSLVVASANDPIGSLAHAKHCATAWGSTFVDIGQAGHINVDSGHGEWTEGYALFQKLAGSSMTFQIVQARHEDAESVAALVGELLQEIMEA